MCQSDVYGRFGLRAGKPARLPRAAAAGTCLVLLILFGGCAGSMGPGGTASTAPADSFLAPVEVPADFDQKRARLPLEQIPGDPASPVKAEPRQGGLPAPALRYMDEARRLFDEQRYSEAIIEVERVLRYSANSPEAYRLMAIACLLSGNDARARLSAEKAVSLNPLDLASHYVIARVADKSGKQDDALREYRLTLKCEPAPEDAGYATLTHYYLGLLLESAGYHAAAIGQLKAFEAGLQALGEKVQDNPELGTIARVHRAAAAMRLAGSQALLGDYAAAAESLRVPASQLSQDLQLRNMYIAMLVRARKFDTAASEAARLVADSKGNKSAAAMLLAVYRAAGRPEQGVDAIRQIVAQQPDNTDLRVIYADALLGAGREREAIQTLCELTALNPNDTATRGRLIELYRKRAEWENWLTVLTELVAIQPVTVQVSDELRLVPREATAQLVGGYLREPPASGPAEGPSARLVAARDYVIGRLAMQIDRRDDGLRLFEQAVRTWPGFVPATAGIAETFLGECRWQEAISLVETAMKARQEPVWQYEQLLGQCYDGQDDIQSAVEHYQKAIQNAPGNSEPIMRFARFCDRLGQAEQAQQQYRAAIAARPEDMRSREGLIHSLLATISPVQPLADQQARLTRILSELAEMQRQAPQDPATIRCAALLKFLETRQREPYLRSIRELIQQRPDDVETRVDLMKALFEFKDYAGARGEAGEILARDPHSNVAGEVTAAAMTRMLALDEAVDQYRRMLECHPNRENWIRQIIDLRLVQQEYPAAIELCDRLLALKNVQSNPDRLMLCRMRLAQVLREARQADRLRQLAGSWLADAGDSQRHRRFYRALCLSADAGAGDYDGYLARCRDWLKEKPDDAEARRWFLLGLIRAERGDEAAAQTLEWFRDTSSGDAMIGTLVDVLGASGHSAGAVELARSQLAGASQEERLNRLLALQAAYLKAGRYDDAVKAMKELIGQGEKTLGHPVVIKLQEGLARLLSQAGRYDEAVSLANGLIQEAEDDKEDSKQRKADLLRMLSAIHQRQGRKDLAEQRLREAYDLNPGEIGVNNDLGYTLADEGKQLDEARRMIRLALGEEPRQVAYMDSYGWVLYKAGEFAEAVSWLQRALRVADTATDTYLERLLTNPAAPLEEGEDAVIYDHLGDAQWRLGRRSDAERSWKRSRDVYEKQKREGEDNSDKDLPDRLKAKLGALERGREPETAPLAPTSRPASEPSSEKG